MFAGHAFFIRFSLDFSFEAKSTATCRENAATLTGFFRRAISVNLYRISNLNEVCRSGFKTLYRAGVQGAGRSKKRSIHGVCGHFSEGRNPEMLFERGF
jgi:hypothetical protein